MRLHHLSITAFGPFATTVEVDFDDLAQTGLFLLTGATGAGKSSVLDAVCFGLYGEVPGDRHAAKHLRSDHAAADAVPEVVLTLSVADRTLRFTRSPAWERPKRRGTGTTRQQAHVVVEEQHGNDWIGLTTRLDDAGLLVTNLLGMTCTQFTQVAMLPQGRFQQFLRASSIERHAVLQRLFRTDRFERVERWLVERRLQLRRESQVCHERVTGVVHRIQEAAASEVPEAWDLHDLSAPAAAGELADWSTALRTRSHDSAEIGRAELDRAGVAASTAQRALDDAEQHAALRRRALDARAQRAALDASSPRAAAHREAISRHHRAGPVSALAHRAEAAAIARASTAADLTAALTAAGLKTAIGLDALAELELAAIREQGVAATAVATQRTVTEVRGQVADAEAVVTPLASACLETETALDQLPVHRATMVAELAEASERAAELPRVEVAAERSRTGHAAAVSLVKVRASTAAAESLLVECVSRAQELRGVYQDAREARIGAMAAELAGDLASGCSCPVCGSLSHPAPATASGHGSRDAEDAARKAYESSDFLRLTQAEAVATLHGRVAPLAKAAGDEPVETWATRLTRADHDVLTARTALERSKQLAAALAELDRSTAELRARLSENRLDLARAEAHRAQATATLATETAALAVLLGDFASVDELIDHHERRVGLIGAACSMMRAHDNAVRAEAEAAEAAAKLCAEAGFESLTDARSATLTEQELQDAERLLGDRARAEAGADAVLAEPGVDAALALPEADLDALAAVAGSAAETHHRAALVASETSHRADRLAALDDELTRELETWAPLRSATALVSSLSSFAEGKSVDNPLRMRLSDFVLSERLRQVVDAANSRLGRMSGGRYSLQHSDERSVGAQRGGLSLLVRDEWSGVLRDPATLSGGETFVVSLALALGLADTVSHEAGGVDIDTLFIDEGFGSLDADTLEDVMDTLDSLREGGRVIGVVSHVTEMRDRITTQLEVRKGRSGSTLVAH